MLHSGGYLLCAARSCFLRQRSEKGAVERRSCANGVHGDGGSVSCDGADVGWIGLKVRRRWMGELCGAKATETHPRERQ